MGKSSARPQRGPFDRHDNVSHVCELVQVSVRLASSSLIVDDCITSDQMEIGYHEITVTQTEHKNVQLVS